MDEYRRLPSVDSLLQTPQAQDWALAYGRALVTESVRAALDEHRARIAAGNPCPPVDELLRDVGSRLEAVLQPSLRQIINATGVILHTNLGRAPLSPEVLAAMQRAGQGYSNLEYDLDSGERGSRYVHAEALLCRLTGAEAALLVNNNAGALLLMLSALAAEREVIISRGQLVEIGGGFRIPDVMAQSGASLVEVGTTNRTYLGDYATALNEASAALLRVHASNYRIQGFTHMPSLADLAGLAHQRGVLLLDDLGSGTLLDTAAFGLEHEPTVQESVAQGADVVSFSGDKLLGGPQAGIIVGKREPLSCLRRHPLTRALRVDKTTIAGVQANLLHYVKGEAAEVVPVWRMIAATADQVAVRVRALLDSLGPTARGCEIVPGQSTVGGGSLPGETLPTSLIALPGHASGHLAAALRTGAPPVVARTQDERVLLDLRTVLPGQEEALAARLRQVLTP